MTATFPIAFLFAPDARQRNEESEIHREACRDDVPIRTVLVALHGAQATPTTVTLTDPVVAILMPHADDTSPLLYVNSNENVPRSGAMEMLAALIPMPVDAVLATIEVTETHASDATAVPPILCRSENPPPLIAFPMTVTLREPDLAALARIDPKSTPTRSKLND